jgi:hypothetical protein
MGQEVPRVDKVVLFAFNREPMCFTHVLLNALDFDARGFEVKLVIEGSATQLIPELADPAHELHSLFEKVRKQVLLTGACRACAAGKGALEAAQEQGLHLLQDMSGHPSIAAFVEQGYKVIIF